MRIFRQNILVTAAVLLVALSACSYRGGNAYLPQRNGIEAGENVTVGGNENIYTIAREHNVSMRELIVLNGLKPPFEVKPGQSLTLPATGASFNGEMKPPAAAPLDAVEKSSLAPIEPAAVTSTPLNLPPAVAAPTSLGAPSQAPTSLAPTNLPPVGVPPTNGTLTTPTLSPQSLNAAKSSVVAAIPAEPVKALNQPSPPQKQVATTLAPITGSVAAASAAASPTSGDEDDAPVTMKWPVQGPILSSFGSKGAGLSNDGVNIGAPKGSPVVAAAPGTVVYAGNEMKGFGNLVLIRHHGDWVTAYAHLDRVLVKKDSIVAQGDEIGTVGKTGNVPSPQLHFEIRENGKAVDPSMVIKADS